MDGRVRELDEDKKMMKLEEAAAISTKNKGLLAEVKEVVRRFLPAAEVYLYGSAARGTQEPDSDYDILVLTDEPLSKSEEKAVEHAILDLELRREVVVSTMYYSRDEWDAPLARVSPFHNEVEREAIVL